MSKNILPPKELVLYMKLVFAYNKRQNKIVLRLAKQILSNPKCAKHGETLSMKALALNCMGRRQEALECAQKGLSFGLQSPTCWNVIGLLQKYEKKYDLAIKSYENGLKWDDRNVNLLRELAVLQIHTRNFEGYRESAHRLLMLLSFQRAPWIMYAISLQLLGDYSSSISVLEEMLSLWHSKGQCDHTHSELLLYQNMVIRESGDLKKALSHLAKYQDEILDKVTLNETAAELSLQLNQYEKATKYFENLIARNPENSAYYEKLIMAKQLTNSEDILKFYYAQSEKYPRTKPPKRLALNHAVGNTFRVLTDNFLRRGLRKGVPALFVELASLYSDTGKVGIIESLLLQYMEYLITTGHFCEKDTEDDLQESPTCLLWTYYFLAQHYDKLKRTQDALTYIDSAIEHTPTLIDLYIVKGKMYKHAGDLDEACKWLYEAQSLDTADQNVNSKYVKYLLRANRTQEAENIWCKFAQIEVPVMESLRAIKCSWYLTECALANQRLQKYGECLKNCHDIDRQFSEIFDDQLDFHLYCLKTKTITTYLQFLRMEDVLCQSKYYLKAARCAIQVYLYLFDSSSRNKNLSEEMRKLTLREEKKLRNKQRKAQKKAEQNNTQSKGSSRQGNKPKFVAEDESPQLEKLVPEDLVNVKDPLDQAVKFLKPLQTFVKDQVETHLLAFEIYFRKDKFLLMLQSLKRAKKVDAADSKYVVCLTRFLEALDRNKETLHPIVKEALDSEIKILNNL